MIKLWEGGLVFYGGLLACLVVATLYTRRQNWSLKQAGDLLVPGLALGHAIGRLGCLMAGCCYGRPVSGDPWWALTFPDRGVGLVPAGIPLYPTQIMESLLELSLFAVLILIRRRKRFTGQVFLSYLMVYAVLRSVLELFRGDAVRGFLIPGLLSTSQFISLAVFVACLVYYRRLSRLQGEESS